MPPVGIPLGLVVPGLGKVFVFRSFDVWRRPSPEPWQPTAAGNPATERTWTAQEAVVSFKNPRKDVVVYLEAETCLRCFPRSPTLTVSVGPAATTLPIESREPFLRRFRARVADFGDDEWVDLRLRMSESFVPSQLTPPPNADPRRLGLFVYHLSLARVEDVSPLDGLDIEDLRPGFGGLVVPGQAAVSPGER